MDRLDRLQRALNFAGDTHALEHVAQAVKGGEANWWQGSSPWEI